MIDIGLGHYLTLGAVIFSIGVIGIFLNRKNIIVILMSIELILLAVNINLVATKLIFTASNINSILINMTMMFFLLRKIPITPIEKITAPKVK